MNPNLSPYENYRQWKWFFIYQAETPQFSTKAEQELLKKYRMIWLEQQIAFDPPKEIWVAKRDFILRRRAGEKAVEPVPGQLVGSDLLKAVEIMQFISANSKTMDKQDLELFSQCEKKFKIQKVLTVQELQDLQNIASRVCV